MRFFIIFFIFLGAINAFSQGEMLDFESFDGGDGISSAKDIKKIKGKSVLIVPFNYDLYNNQESEKMVKASEMEYEQMINYMRLSLDSAIVRSLKDSIKVVSLLSNYTAGVNSDIEYVHGHAIYYMMDKPLPVVESDEKYSLFQNKKSAVSDNVLKNNIQGGEIVSKIEDNSDKFLNVKFDNINLINDITTKYQTRYILFITEFDLFGSYSNAYPEVGGAFSRIIKVHYSIYENTGDFVYGDFALAPLPSIEDDVSAVCAGYFPEIAQKIAKKLP